MTSGKQPHPGSTSEVARALHPTAGPPRPWRVRPQLSLAELDAGAPELTRLQMQLLANRGIVGAADAFAYLRASWRATPPEPLGLAKAVARVRTARTRQERVVVFGDYDVDGLTSCALMVLALRQVGIDTSAYLPSRSDDGRGLNTTAVRELANAGASLVVTTDCSTTNVVEVQLAASLGLDVVITDHHAPQGEIAAACAVVNPRQPECPSREKNLAGVGVALRVAEALLTGAETGSDTDTLEALLDLVAVGTIGDVVALTKENWRLVRAGLARLNRAPRPGLRALVTQLGLRLGEITERDISFALAPCLNAAGRMGDATVALRLLLADDEREALDLARQLQALNAERQRQTETVMVQAHAQAIAQLERPDAADFPIVVTRGEGWPLGLIGLVAGRLAEEFGRPALAVSITGAECRGSARGPAGFNLVEALAQRAELFRYFGGHAQAAGFTLATLDLPALLEHLQAAARQQRDDGQSTSPSATPPLAGVVEPDVAEVATLAVAEATADPADAAVIEMLPVALDGRELDIDCQLPLRLASAETYAAIRQLAPYGPGFPVPLFLAQGVRVLRCWRSGPEGRTLRLRLRQGASESTALWSRQGARYAELQGIGLVDVVYTLDAYARPEAPTDHFMRVVTLRSAAEPVE